MCLCDELGPNDCFSSYEHVLNTDSHSGSGLEMLAMLLASLERLRLRTMYGEASLSLERDKSSILYDVCGMQGSSTQP